MQVPNLTNYAPAKLSFNLQKGNNSTAKSNAQINSSEISGTSLAMAAMSLESAKKFVEQGNLYRKDSVNNTIMHFAVIYDKLDVIKYLIDKGADVEAKNQADQTPLFYAVQYAQADIARYLISIGADKNTKDITGENLISKANSMKSYWLENQSNPAAQEQIRDYNDVIAVLNDRSIIVNKPIKKSEISNNEKIAFVKAKSDDTIMAYEKFTATYPTSTYSSEIKELLDKKRTKLKADPEKEKEILNKIVSFLEKKDVDGLLKYANSNPLVMEFARNHPQIYLLFTGPKELQVGKILQYKKHGLGDGMLSSKIKSLNKPYRKFSLEEMEVLIKLGLSEKLIMAMLDVTTEYEKEHRQQTTQLNIIKEQERIAKENKSTTVINQPSQQQQTLPQDDSVGGKVMEKVAEKAIEGLIRNLF